ncbi:MAG: hypothetical protein IKW98_10855 [Prevotella sp.]|nr:hypothetical protein [Prevotella sp.]
MKTKLFFLSALMLASTHAIQAQNSWAMAEIKDGDNWPTIAEYHGMPEKGANDNEYLRIYDYRMSGSYYNPIKLQYGYRMADKQIFIYDFEKDEERLAFDFTLSAGDHFITYNGMEWEVDATMDTLVNISYKGKGENTTKRLLKVHSVDGRHSDQWLEDFGSLANHFMIRPMIESGQMQTLWMEYEYGYNLVREFSSDPFYTHDSGKPDEINEQPANESASRTITFNDGTLKVENIGWHSPNRVYSFFYRVDDGLYCVYVWLISPATGAAYVVWHHDTSWFYGLPTPQSGGYSIHSMDERPAGISIPTNDSSKDPVGLSTYDLQGRKLSNSKWSNGQIRKGIYVKDGRKFVVK